MIDPSVAIRQTSALVLVSTLVWDMFREKYRYEAELATWVLAINFVYFQLPLRSRALAFFHPLAFMTSIVTPTCYLFLMYCNPNYEHQRMNDWDMKWSAMAVRSLLMYAAPLVCHVMDVGSIGTKLVFAYQGKSRKLQIGWCILGFFIVDGIHFLLHPNRHDMSLLGVGENFSLLLLNVKTISVSLAFFALYMLVLRDAYPPLTPIPSRRPHSD
jgi:hypothetical protein